MHKKTIVCLIAAYFCFYSCAEVKLQSSAAQAATEQSVPNTITLHRWFLGYVANGIAVDSVCSSQGFQSVKVKTSFGQGLVTVVTLGVYCPVTVYYWCAKKPPPVIRH